MNLTPRNSNRRLVIGGALSCAWLWVASALSAVPLATQAPTADQAAFFEAKIRPALANKCYVCHGATTQLGGLRLDSMAAILKGGDSGPALVPGDPDKSLIIKAVRQTGTLKMPQGGKLDPGQVADLEAWVKMGAPWPAAAGSVDNKLNLWSLKPVAVSPIPKVKGAALVKNPIDAFILAKLEAKKLSLAAPADRRTLIRRVTYDLIGLPPTAAEVDEFLADKAPAAYEKVVDRLLASPRYGERWGRHWLDVARYADTKGYVFEEDRNYYNAYTYRDWVIEALNRDLPYDQFIIHQLAADRLPEVQNGDDKRPLAALGFLTVGRRFLNSRQDIIDDRIDVTMRGLQGFTAACARCHDHKFDPIPSQDYYSLYAVFDSSQEVSAPISEKSIRDPWEKYNQQVIDLQASSRQLISSEVRRLRRKKADPEGAKTLAPEVLQTLQDLREDQVPDGPKLKTLMKAFSSTVRDAVAENDAKLDGLKKSAPQTPEFAMAMADGQNAGDGVVFKRGNPANRGEPAPRRFLLALSKPGVEREHWTTGSGRLELAKAIASRDNPLTARVFVNRVWMHLFGTGIVRTPSDFGHQGDPPTHPELLDYLASKFMDEGWSIKKLIKLIVTSATYRQASTESPADADADPDDRLLSRMPRKRLDLEEMRDTLMAAAGRLDVSNVGGKSIDLWAQPFNPRRAVYGFVERQNLPGIFKTFDFASPDATSARRFTTTVPQQALFFMNSPFSMQEAEGLVNRPEIKSSQDDAQRVRRLYRLLFQRLPDAQEAAAGAAYLKRGSLEEMSVPQGEWRYGYGGMDPAHQKVTSFTPLGVFKDGGYRVGDAFPDPGLGYLMLNIVGGHPGHDADHSVIRRWVAPADMTVQISGTLAHRQPQGDGVKGRIISSRTGLLGEWEVHNREQAAEVASVEVQKGDTLDFVVDPMTSDAYDAFAWSPVVRSVDGKRSWDSATNFGPPPGRPVTRLTLYAQALMMTNEFMFVD
ncbi:MAG TPA: PSD1 and planctomycete cytochrome C domain-containing protein [Fimbriimonadaceae bacterium]|nr:PSD1 and planctomycete cytochrome C domain-containing protein [Fimbriimonadaceae bacterium]